MKIGTYIIVWSLMTVVKVKTIRKKGSLTSLWVESKKYGEFPLNTIDDKLYVAKLDKSIETGITKVSTMFNIIGLVCAFLIYKFLN